MKRVLFAFLCMALPTAVAAQSLEQAVNTITEADMYRLIEAMAHDSMRGRDTPSPELDKTADYVAAEFRRIGLLPGGDAGTYIQRYPLTEMRRELTVAIAGAEDWLPGTHVVQMAGGSANVSAPLTVITGSGEPSEPLDLDGEIVLLIAEWGGRGVSAPSQQLLTAIQAANPAAAIVATNIPERFWNYFSGRQTRSQFTMGAEAATSDDPPFLFTQLETAEALLDGHGVNVTWRGEPQVHTMDNLTFDLNASLTTASNSAPNVVGILEGSDPDLKDEYVVLSAHMDHVGVTGRPVDGDSIMNGADDNASGTAGVIEAAEAFAAMDPRPKRSMIFLAVSGEEKGLWGSAYYSDHPNVPVSQIVANINTDMIGRNWSDTIVAIGKEYSDLGETLDRVNAEHPELNMAAIDDIWPDEQFYRRSDHYNFAEKGIPVLFFFNGTHEDYHGVNDEIDRVDTEKAARIVKLMFYLGVEIANTPERPKWKATG